MDWKKKKENNTPKESNFFSFSDFSSDRNKPEVENSYRISNIPSSQFSTSESLFPGRDYCFLPGKNLSGGDWRRKRRSTNSLVKPHTDSSQLFGKKEEKFFQYLNTCKNLSSAIFYLGKKILFRKF